MAERSTRDAGEATPTQDLEASRSAEPAPSDVREPVPVEPEVDPGERLGRPGPADDPTSFDTTAPDAVGEDLGDPGAATIADHADGDLSGLVPGSDLGSDPYDGVDGGLTPADSPIDTEVERELGGLDGSFDPAGDFIDGVGPDPHLQDLDPSAAGDEPVSGAGYQAPGSYSESEGITGVKPSKSGDAGEPTTLEKMQASMMGHSGTQGQQQMQAALEADDDVAGVTPGGGSTDGGTPTDGAGPSGGDGAGGDKPFFTGVSHLSGEEQAALAEGVEELKASTPEGKTAVFDDGHGTRFIVHGNKKPSAPNEDVVDGEGQVDFDPTDYEDDPSQYLAIKLASERGDDIYVDETNAGDSAPVEQVDFGDDVMDTAYTGELPTYDGPDTIGDQVPDGGVIDPME